MRGPWLETWRIPYAVTLLGAMVLGLLAGVHDWGALALNGGMVFLGLLFTALLYWINPNGEFRGGPRLVPRKGSRASFAEHFGFSLPKDADWADEAPDSDRSESVVEPNETGD